MNSRCGCPSITGRRDVELHHPLGPATFLAFELARRCSATFQDQSMHHTQRHIHKSVGGGGCCRKVRGPSLPFYGCEVFGRSSPGSSRSVGQADKDLHRTREPILRYHSRGHTASGDKSGYGRPAVGLAMDHDRLAHEYRAVCFPSRLGRQWAAGKQVQSLDIRRGKSLVQRPFRSHQRPPLEQRDAVRVVMDYFRKGSHSKHHGCRTSSVHAWRTRSG